MYKIKIVGCKTKLYQTKKQFNLWLPKHLGRYGKYYTIETYELLPTGNWKFLNIYDRM